MTAGKITAFIVTNLGLLKYFIPTQLGKWKRNPMIFRDFDELLHKFMKVNCFAQSTPDILSAEVLIFLLPLK